MSVVSPPPAAAASSRFALFESTRRPNGTFVVVPPFMYGDAMTIRAPVSCAAWSIRVMWSGE